MNCENIQFNLPLYAEDELTHDERALLEEHLSQCPLCRAKNSEFLALQRDLRVLPNPELPADLMVAVKNRVALEIKQTKREPFFSTNVREWLQYRLMPYSVGTALSLILTFFFLYSLNSTKRAAEQIELARNEAKPALVLTNPNRSFSADEFVLSKEEYAALRIPVANRSPSLNPSGAFVALTKTILRGGKMQDDEVTLVTDVFGDGLAKIAQVVEAPRSRQSLEELQNALENDPSYAPFVPAKMDNRSDDVRVILKIIRVDVVDREAKIKKPAVK